MASKAMPINRRRKSDGKHRRAPKKDRGRNKTASRLGAPQRERIKAKFIAGKSKTQIAREEKRDRHTVIRIVAEQDVADYVKNLRSQWYGKLDEVLESAIKHAIRGWDDGRLAYKMCVDAGIIPSLGEAKPKVLDVTDEQTMVKKIATRMLEGAIERHKWFELPFPEADEVEAEIKAKEEEDA